MSGESNLRALLEEVAKPSIEQRLAAAEADFNDAVDGAVETAKAALEGTTSSSEFPSAANPPARRHTGAFIDAFRRIDRKPSDGKYEAEIGWHDFNFQDYFAYQEKGFQHATARRFIRGVNSLTHAQQSFTQEMASRGYK